MKQIINGKLYNSETAEHLADNEFSDGSNRMSGGTSTTLCKTRKGAFFALHLTCWQGSHDHIEVLDIEEAKALYENLRNHQMEYAEAFGCEPEVA